ncbi:hypothetical protein [Oceanobacillus sp. FSL W7-1293]|uniref:hypothetical protein n=1 Tax=Oceanobacillus sp. FSL W7-1293 TaxID=2921699 RepID=UPI0030CA69CA
MGKKKLKDNTPSIINFPEYETAFMTYFQETVNNFIDLKNEIFEGIKKNKHDGPISMRTETSENDFLDKAPTKIEMSFSLPVEAILNTDVEALIVEIDKASDSGLESLIPQLINYLSEVTEKTGQVVDAKGKGFSFDFLLEMIEKIEISFEDDGTPIMPTLLVNPKMKETILKNIPTNDQEKRMEEIISKKRDDFFAKKRTRRLY